MCQLFFSDYVLSIAHLCLIFRLRVVDEKPIIVDSESLTGQGSTKCLSCSIALNVKAVRDECRHILLAQNIFVGLVNISEVFLEILGRRV